MFLVSPPYNIVYADNNCFQHILTLSSVTALILTDSGPMDQPRHKGHLRTSLDILSVTSAKYWSGLNWCSWVRVLHAK